MKITKEQLKDIIKEELTTTLKETSQLPTEEQMWALVRAFNAGEAIGDLARPIMELARTVNKRSP
jgi:hypothetical protein